MLKLDEDRRFEREERRRLDEESDGGSLNGFIVSGSEEEEEEEEEGRRGGRGKKKQKLKKPQLVSGQTEVFVYMQGFIQDFELGEGGTCSSKHPRMTIDNCFIIF